MNKTVKIIGGIVLGLGAIFGAYKIYQSKKNKVQVDENGNIVDNKGKKQEEDGGSQGGGSSSQTENLRITKILGELDKNTKFSNADDAKYFIQNIDSVDENKRPSNDDIKKYLLKSGLAYFNGNIEPRMSRADADKIIVDNAPTLDGKKVIKYKGGFESPDLSPYTTNQLKRLLAHGYWLALWYDGGGNYAGHNQGYAATSAGGYFVVTTIDLAGSNDGHLRKVTVPTELQGEPYSYSAEGKIRHSRKRDKVRLFSVQGEENDTLN